MYSPVVKGIDGSDIVVTTSTNGTFEMIALYKLGSKLITAPINKPPALPPAANKLSGSTILLFTNPLVTSIKS